MFDSEARVENVGKALPQDCWNLSVPERLGSVDKNNQLTWPDLLVCLSEVLLATISPRNAVCFAFSDNL